MLDNANLLSEKNAKFTALSAGEVQPFSLSDADVERIVQRVVAEVAELLKAKKPGADKGVS